MASRSVWKGFLQFSLVNVPVKAYTAAVSGGGGISLNQLHKECHSRINYKKVCPVHGEVPANEIVSGYEFAKGQYVVIDADEIDKLRSEKDKAINIAAFIEPACLDIRYYSGRTYYLAPDGPVAQKPYALLYKAMRENDRYAFAQVVMQGKEQIVLIRPVDGLLMMSFLNYQQEIKSPAEFQDEVPKHEIGPDEMKLAKTLMDALAVRDFDFSQYHDKYVENLTKLIEAKVSGQEIVAPAGEEQPQVINLMEALQKSIDAAKQARETTGTAAGKPPKQVAPSRAAAAAAGTQKKRKTS